MLLVWDIHISSLYADKILENINDFVQNFENENNIVLVGDYVYHFVYDRNSLLKLFDLLLSFYKQGKNVYVLAWNHDWISWNFVFQEAKKSFDIINHSGNNKLYFITTPFVESIEWNNVLFLPYNFFLETNEFEGDGSNLANKIKSLLASKNKNENFSWKVNQILWENTNIADKDLFVIHHYYTADKNFPGQKARFTYKDVAIAPEFLEKSNVFFVSWHLHTPFVDGNYFCTWSSWNASFLEQNDIKFFYQIDLWNLKAQAYPYFVNPYFSIEYNNTEITKETLEDHINEVYSLTEGNLKSWNWDISIMDYKIPPLEATNLVIVSEEFDYQNIDQVVDKILLDKLNDLKLKKKNISMKNINTMLETSDKNLQESITNWKVLLEDYLSKKFWENSTKYIEKLKEMKII